MGLLTTERSKAGYLADVVLCAIVTAAAAVLLDALLGTPRRLRANTYSDKKVIAAWEDEGGAPPGATQ